LLREENRKGLALGGCKKGRQIVGHKGEDLPLQKLKRSRYPKKRGKGELRKKMGGCAIKPLEREKEKNKVRFPPRP